MFGEPLIGVSAQSGVLDIVPGQVSTRTLVGTIWGAGATGISSGILYQKYIASGPGAADTEEVHYGYHSLHGYLDPSGRALPYSVVTSDLEWVNFDTEGGGCWMYYGWYEFNTAEDATSVVGLGWRTNFGAQTWEAFCNEGTATPSTSLHSEDSGIASDVPHRLGIWLDGYTKTARFYIDGLLYSTFAPSAVPAQFGSGGVKFGNCGIIGAGNWSDYYIYGGGNPRLLALVDNGVT